MADSRHHGSNDWFTTISISFTYTLCRFVCLEKIPSGREVILLKDRSLRKKIDQYYTYFLRWWSFWKPIPRSDQKASEDKWTFLAIRWPFWILLFKVTIMGCSEKEGNYYALSTKHPVIVFFKQQNENWPTYHRKGPLRGSLCRFGNATQLMQ